MGALFSSTPPLRLDKFDSDHPEQMLGQLLAGTHAVIELPERDCALDRTTASAKTCAVCDTLDAVHRILPCRHLVFCNKCADQIGLTETSQCPECDCRIENIV